MSSFCKTVNKTSIALLHYLRGDIYIPRIISNKNNYLLLKLALLFFSKYSLQLSTSICTNFHTTFSIPIDVQLKTSILNASTASDIENCLSIRRLVFKDGKKLLNVK